MPAANFRLTQILSAGASNTWLSLNYDQYQHNGLLKHLSDTGPKGANNAMDNTATFTYDGLGRLRGVEGPQLPYAGAYVYDDWGNMTAKEGVTLGYSASKPHLLATVGGSAVGHDDNGNRNAKPGQSYAYDFDDHATTINANGHSVNFTYDAGGRRVAKVVDNGASVTRYYSELAEVTDGWLTKYYSAGGLLIASQRVGAPWQLASLPSEPAVRLADISGSQPMIVVILRDDLALPVSASLILIVSVLLIAPWRKKRVVAVAVRHGHVILVLITFSVSTLPVPILIRPASAQVPEPEPAADSTPVPTPTPALPAASALPASPVEPEGLPPCDTSTPPCEDVSLRTEKVAIMRLPGGQYAAVSDGLPRSYQDSSGRWRRPLVGFHAEGEDELADELPQFVTRLSTVTLAGQSRGVISQALRSGDGGITYAVGRPTPSGAGRATLTHAELRWNLELTRRGLAWESEPIAAKRGVTSVAIPYLVDGSWEPLAVEASGAVANAVWQFSRPLLKGAGGGLYPLCQWQTATSPQRLILQCDDTELPESALPYTIDPVSGPKYPATCVSSTGIGTQAWSNAAGALSSNNNRASASLTAAEVTNWLKCSNFGFSAVALGGSGIPYGSTIDGIMAEWEVSASAADKVRDQAARLVKAGAIESSDRASATWWPTTTNETFISHGGSSDTWGGTWEANDIADAGFGAALAAVNTDTSYSRSAYVDSVRLTVTYTTPAHLWSEGYEGSSLCAGSGCASGVGCRLVEEGISCSTSQFDVPASADLRAGARVKVTTLPASQSTIFYSTANPGGTSICGGAVLVKSDGTWALDDEQYSTPPHCATGTVQLAANTWYRIETRADVAGGQWSATLYSDG
ncbi:MAG: hypothetical protein HYS40_03005, partial [Gemmatimonadetes bacterium]|nr:hypothetical protein [Gemmatimonadota bacterium]